MKDSTSAPSEILVIGAGMAAHGFVAHLLRDPSAELRVTVIGDEEHGPYDRSALVGLLAGAEVADLELDRSVFRDDRVLHIDPSAHTARTRTRRTYSYDTLVLATGSYAARAAVSGARLPGCFVLRTIEDAESMQQFAASRARALGRPLRGVVIGGGLHGLETAVALDDAGVGTTIVQDAERLLPAQLDFPGAGVVQSALEERGIAIRTRTRTTRIDPDDSGAVTAIEFQDGTFQRADLVVFAVGVHPRDELARNAGLDVHPQGGVVVNDRGTTSDPHILAIGEAAFFDGRGVDDTSSAHTMAEVAAARLRGGTELYRRHDSVDHHTIAGIDLASFGESAQRVADGIEVVTHRSRGAGIYRKLVLTDDAQTLLGGVLVGDTSGHASLRRLVGGPSHGELAAELRRAAYDPDAPGAVCVHFGMSPQVLLAELRAEELFTFSAVGVRFGREPGCERCTLSLARALAELTTERPPRSLSGRQGEDDRDEELVRPDASRLLVSPAVGADLTPAHLIDIGRIAEDLDLTVGVFRSRIQLRGVSRDRHAALRDRLAAAGLTCATAPSNRGNRSFEERAERTREPVPADPNPSAEADRGATFAVGWREQGRRDGSLRGSPMRAENPA